MASFIRFVIVSKQRAGQFNRLHAITGQIFWETETTICLMHNLLALCSMWVLFPLEGLLASGWFHDHQGRGHRGVKFWYGAECWWYPVIFTVFDKVFIQAVSPEVVGNQPSILFQSSNLESLYIKVKAMPLSATLSLKYLSGISILLDRVVSIMPFGVLKLMRGMLVPNSYGH